MRSSATITSAVWRIKIILSSPVIGVLYPTMSNLCSPCVIPELEHQNGPQFFSMIRHSSFMLVHKTLDNSTFKKVALRGTLFRERLAHQGAQLVLEPASNGNRKPALSTIEYTGRKASMHEFL